MVLDDAISMEPIMAKLKDLRAHMPNQERTIYDFGAYLADNLNPRLVPEGFYMAAQLALYDLQTGVNGFTGKHVPNSLAGYPPQLYAVLNLCIPRIAEAVCPPEFARRVNEIDSEIHKR